MKVYFDARMIGHPGIGRYIRCLLPSMIKYDNVNICLLGNREKIVSILGKGYEIIDFDPPIYSLKEQVGFAGLKKIIRNDILHIPHYNVPVVTGFNMVVTIHDIIYLLYPQGAKTRLAGIYMKFMIGRILKTAKNIICVSNSTRESVKKTFNLKSDSMNVLYEGIDNVFSRITDQGYLKNIKQKYALPDKFMLYVGSIRRHKNIDAMINSFERFKAKAPDARLVIVGRYSQEIDLNKKGIIYLGEVENDTELAGIYNLASCLFNLSLYEGFGFTILEAQNCGLPVICSDISTHKEIGGTGIAAVNPYDIDQIDKNLYNVLSNNEIRKSLVANGLNNVRRFSWASTAAGTIDIYRKTVNESGNSSRLAPGNTGRRESS